MSSSCAPRSNGVRYTPFFEFIFCHSNMNQVANNERRYSCLHCGSAFGRKSNLRVHIDTVHEHMSTRKFACTVEGCGRSLSSPHNLRCHLQSVHYFTPDSSQSVVDGITAGTQPGTESADTALLEIRDMLANMRLPSST
ncbi:hypothetical protein C8T65DRAFT_671636 [Cerioporus squamosus]|nr:hypothetical protein C8T65DRAFT_671636 [Cerioporus squamosus]